MGTCLSRWPLQQWQKHMHPLYTDVKLMDVRVGQTKINIQQCLLTLDMKFPCLPHLEESIRERKTL